MSRKISKSLYEKYILPHKNKKLVTVTFPDIFSAHLSDPFRVSLWKLIIDNPTIQVLTPQDIGIDVIKMYHDSLKFEWQVYNVTRVCYIFVEDKPILVDYSMTSNYKNTPIKRVIKKAGLESICGAIKFQCGDEGDYKNSPVPVFPFHFPGPNDFRKLPDKRNNGNRHVDVFNEVTYSSKYPEQFLENYHQNKFQYSIYARWGEPPFKAYRHRPVYTKLAQQIPNSNMVGHISTKSVTREKYFQLMCQSKFGIAIRGGGKWSHREMELCSVGIPWFCEDRGQRMYKPLISGEHYIAVTPDTFLDVFKYYNEHYEEALEIGLNGREYFNKWHEQTGLQLIFKEIVDRIIKGKI